MATKKKARITVDDSRHEKAMRDPVYRAAYSERRGKWKHNRSAGIVRDDETGIVKIHVRKRKLGETNAYSREIAHGWVVGFDAHRKPIDIEILNPSVAFPPTILKLLPPEFVPKARKKGRR